MDKMKKRAAVVALALIPFLAAAFSGSPSSKAGESARAAPGPGREGPRRRVGWGEAGRDLRLPRRRG